MTADCFCQLTAFLIPDVSRCRTDQSGHRIFLHVFRHIDTDHVFLIIKERLCQSFCELGFADARRAEEQEGANRLRRILDAGLGPHNGLGNLADRLILANHSLMKLFIEMQGLVALRLRQLCHRNSGPAGDNRRNFIVGDLLMNQRLVLVLCLGLFRLHLLLQIRQRAVLQLRSLIVVALLLSDLDVVPDLINLLLQTANLVDVRLFILPLGFLCRKGLLQFCKLFVNIVKPLLRELVVFLLQCSLLNLQLHDLVVHLVEIFRKGIHLRFDHCAGFIHKVDGLVRKEPIRDVTIRKRRSRYQSGVLNFNAVIYLKAVLQSAENGNCILHGRLLDHNRLETACQCLIFLDVFTILVQRCGTDAVQLAACEHGLEHVAGIERSFGCARTDNCVQLIDEQNDLTIALLYFLENRFQTFLEFAAVLCTRDQRTHVQRENLLVLQVVRNIALINSLRKSLDNSGFADTGFTDEDRVILRLARENTDNVADFIITADDRVKLVVMCLGDELLAVLLERIVCCFRIVRCHTDIAADSLQDLEKTVAVDVIFPEKSADCAVCILDEREEQMLD